jgi:chromosomal replication initiator protein
MWKTLCIKRAASQTPNFQLFMPSYSFNPDEVEQIWQQACSQLQQQLSPAVYNTWILANPITAINVSEERAAEIIVTSPTAFHSTNLKKNLHERIKEVVDEVLQKDCDIKYIIGNPHEPKVPSAAVVTDASVAQTDSSATQADTTAAQADSSQNPSLNRVLSSNQNAPSAQADQSPHHSSPISRTSQPFFTPHPTKQPISPRVEDLFSESNIQSAAADRIQAIARSIGLRPDFTFETFAVSTTNEMAHAAASAVSNRPGDSYNPLFLYGGVGVGKTHLMHAIGNNILQNNPNARILYSTGEEFTNEIVQAIQTKKARYFKEKYRTVHVLLVDDVQFIAGKNAVQEEFFHTFNALTKQQSQVVLTSDRPPHEINLMEDRLRSRFEAGLMIDIQQPSFELRTAILLVKAKAQRLSIPIELAKTIASRVESARKIEGIITSIRSEIELKGKELNADLIESILKVEVEQKRPTIRVTPADVIKTVANHYRLKQTALKGKRRVKELVTARHIAMYLLKEELSLPLTEIGKWFSGRDHTSVLHATKKIQKDIRINENTRQDVSALRMTLAAIS